MRKSLEKSYRYVQENKKPATKAVREKVAPEMEKVGLLENNVIVPITSLSDETIHKGTLNATE